MIWLLVILEDLIHIEECSENVASSFNFFPNEEGNPIYFETKQLATEWVSTNIKPEFIYKPNEDLTVEEIRSKYLVG